MLDLLLVLYVDPSPVGSNMFKVFPLKIYFLDKWSLVIVLRWSIPPWWKSLEKASIPSTEAALSKVVRGFQVAVSKGFFFLIFIDTWTSSNSLLLKSLFFRLSFHLISFNIFNCSFLHSYSTHPYGVGFIRGSIIMQVHFEWSLMLFGWRIQDRANIALQSPLLSEFHEEGKDGKQIKWHPELSQCFVYHICGPSDKVDVWFLV